MTQNELSREIEDGGTADEDLELQRFQTEKGVKSRINKMNQKQIEKQKYVWNLRKRNATDCR